MKGLCHSLSPTTLCRLPGPPRSCPSLPMVLSHRSGRSLPASQTPAALIPSHGNALAGSYFWSLPSIPPMAPSASLSFPSLSSCPKQRQNVQCPEEGAEPQALGLEQGYKLGLRVKTRTTLSSSSSKQDPWSQKQDRGDKALGWSVGYLWAT